MKYVYKSRFSHTWRQMYEAAKNGGDLQIASFWMLRILLLFFYLDYFSYWWGHISEIAANFQR